MTPLGESEPLVPEHASDRARYDHKTIFYDVFFSADGKDLLCIGPPLLNFGMPLAITCGKQALKFTVETPFYSVYLNFSLVRIKAADCRQMQAPSFNLHFRFADFEVAVSCSPQKVMPLAKKTLTLATLQKDNEVQWIKDWCVWHNKAHNVERIIIYDNGSANFEEIYAKLSALDVELVFVHWPYLYGPVPDAEIVNAYCQIGSLNHCRLFFGGSTEWCINLDVDEYLYTGDGLSLESCISKPWVRASSVVLLGSYLVPAAETSNGNGVARCFDFGLRSNRFRGNGREDAGCRKYIYRPNRVAANLRHEVLVKSRWPFFRLALQKALISLRKPQWYFAAAKPDADKMFFYHFAALGTSWKPGGGHIEWKNKWGGLVADGRIAEMATLIGSAGLGFLKD